MRRALSRYLYVVPAALPIVALALMPLAAVLWLSFRRVLPVFGVDRFVGLSNYIHLLSDQRFLSSLLTTLYFAVLAVVLELGIGLAIALLLHRSFRGRALVRASVLVPWALPTVVAARIWEWIYNPDFGVLDYLLVRWSILAEKVPWLGDPFWAIHAAILADVWKTTPFAALILLAGLAQIPEDLLKAARVDGAGPVRVFGEIVLPLLAPAIVVAALFRFLDSLRVFDAIYVLTGGGPANTTETLSIYVYKILFQTLRFGYGSAVAAAMFVIAAAASVVIWNLGGGRRRLTESSS
jgi:trehalose/maltose transport system permease protein